MNTNSTSSTPDIAGDQTTTTSGRTAPSRSTSFRLAAVGLSVAAMAVAGSVWLQSGSDDKVTSTSTTAQGGTSATSADPAASSAAVDAAEVTSAAAGTKEPGRATGQAVAPVELGRETGDIDGDGLLDVVRLLASDGSSAPDQIEISWGTEGSELHALTGGGEGALLPLADIDGDGDLEIVVNAGGGEASWYDVFTFDGTDVVQVHAAEAGDEISSINAYETPDGTTTYDDGFVEYRFVDPAATAPTAVELHEWTLDGTTLTRSEQSTSGCWTFQGGSYGIERGSC